MEGQKRCPRIAASLTLGVGAISYIDRGAGVGYAGCWAGQVTAGLVNHTLYLEKVTATCSQVLLPIPPSDLTAPGRRNGRSPVSPDCNTGLSASMPDHSNNSSNEVQLRVGPVVETAGTLSLLQGACAASSLYRQLHAAERGSRRMEQGTSEQQRFLFDTPDPPTATHPSSGAGQAWVLLHHYPCEESYGTEHQDGCCRVPIPSMEPHCGQQWVYTHCRMPGARNNGKQC